MIIIIMIFVYVLCNTPFRVIIIIMNKPNNKPTRKPYRLKYFDYSSCGMYFLTFRTKVRANHFWATTDEEYHSPEEIELSPYGKIVFDAITNIPNMYDFASVEYFVVMPDHVHILLLINSDEYGRPISSISISRIINQTKGRISRKIGQPIWEKSFYDHIIRKNKEYEACVAYIYDNPIRWYMKHVAKD